MGKYYQNGSANTVCDDLNGWEKMLNGSACGFQNQSDMYEDLIQEHFPVQFKHGNKIDPSGVASKSGDIAPNHTSEREAIEQQIEKTFSLYYVPILFLRQGETARLQILIRVDDNATLPTRIEITHTSANPANPTFSITGGIITSVSAGLKKAEISIQCLNTFSDYETIEARAIFGTPGHESGAICGQLKVHPNDVVRTVNVLIAKVKLQIGRKVTEGREISATSAEMLRVRRMFDNQSLIDINVVEYPNDIPMKDTVVQTHSFTKAPMIVSHALSPNYVDTDEDGDLLVQDKSGFNQLTDIAFKNYLKSQNIAENTYDDYIKVFTFGCRHARAAGITSSENIVLFEGGTNETLAHELGHGLSLTHTFVASELSPEGLFSYQAKKTDNIMDYSHMDFKTRFSFFHWQMQQMWRCIDTRDTTVRPIPQLQSNAITHSTSNPTFLSVVRI